MLSRLGCWTLLYAALLNVAATSVADERLLYVVAPGIRNQLEFGGAGILVFDIDHDHKFARRIATVASRNEKPENIKGVCACAATARLYFSTPTKLYCVNLLTDETLWEISPPKGCDRMSIVPDGSLLYVPSFENDIWNVIDAQSGELVTSVQTGSGSHNTVVGRDGRRMYLAGLRSPILSVADTTTHQVVNKVGPFSAAIRPFTVNGAQTRCYACVNSLLGFEIGDLTTGRVLERVEVADFKQGPAARHGCPSHGVGLTADEREVWVCDAFNRRLHVFDVTRSPAKQIASIVCRDEPGWITFGLDGTLAYSSTGEVIDAKTKQIVAALVDESGRAVHSEKMLEIDFSGGRPTKNGDQFGVGRVVPPVGP